MNPMTLTYQQVWSSEYCRRRQRTPTEAEFCLHASRSPGCCCFWRNGLDLGDRVTVNLICLRMKSYQNLSLYRNNYTYSALQLIWCRWDTKKRWSYENIIELTENHVIWRRGKQSALYKEISNEQLDYVESLLRHWSSWNMNFNFSDKNKWKLYFNHYRKCLVN